MNWRVMLIAATATAAGFWLAADVIGKVAGSIASKLIGGP